MVSTAMPRYLGVLICLCRGKGSTPAVYQGTHKNRRNREGRIVFFCCFPPNLPWGLYSCLSNWVLAQIRDVLCDCTTVPGMTQEKLTLLVVPTRSSLNPKYGLNQCVFRAVNTAATQKGGNGYCTTCWSWDVVAYPLLGV